VSDDDWISAVVYSDKVTAEAILGLLTAEGVPAYIKSDEHVPGLGSNFSIHVPADRLRQARWLLKQTHVSDKELTYLATGESGDPSDDA
jgi:hypothetical protein